MRVSISDIMYNVKKDRLEVKPMPTKPKKMCKHHRCPNLTDSDYCEEHKHLYTRASSSSRGYTSKWRKLSKAYLKRNPLCVNCLQDNKLTEATVVDHIKPHRGDEILMWSENNWQSLCKKCHDKKTGLYDSKPTYKY